MPEKIIEASAITLIRRPARNCQLRHAKNLRQVKGEQKKAAHHTDPEQKDRDIASQKLLDREHPERQHCITFLVSTFNDYKCRQADE
ncbi:MAG: hypothetical protein ACYCVB_19200 [Bacilli bacterium]